MKFAPLPQSFYEPSAEHVAPQLLGHWLIRRTAHGVCGGPIVETEAYLANDSASHGFIGETARNRVMYGEPGFTYVYFIYGNHFCVNAVCQPPGRAEAVLIRAVESQFGEELMRRHRPVKSTVELTNGPGKLCAALQIGRTQNCGNFCDPASPLIIARNPDVKNFRKEHGPVVTTLRIGITRSADLPLRFCLGGSRYLSRKLPVLRSCSD